MDLYKPSTIVEILTRYGLYTKKHFGQNFLVDKNTLDKIIKTAEITKDDTVLEIGPGIGVLTTELAKNSKKVISLELDRNLIPVLSETLSEFNNVEIINTDALKFDSSNLGKYKIVANIPYYITSPLINHFLQQENKPQSLTLLVQKEVAEKAITLEPDMTILSLQIALFGQAKMCGKVSKGCFFPPPKVDSAILKIDVYPLTHPNYTSHEDAQKILTLAKKAFSQKRKKLSNTLGKISTEIDLNRRPETLSIKEWKII